MRFDTVYYLNVTLVDIMDIGYHLPSQGFINKFVQSDRPFVYKMAC